MTHHSPEAPKTTSWIGLNFDDAGRFVMVGGGAFVVVALLLVALNTAHQFAP